MKQARRLFLSLVTLMLCTLAYAQTEIRGTVVDDLGEGVIGATVKEKGTSNGTVTDFDGNFKLKVKAGTMLVISYIGFDTQEVPAQAGMKVQMKDNAKELAEVVVTGYQTQRKADLTGSVAVVQTKELKTSSDTDPMRALQGKVPGMTITSNGSPVGAGTVRIRGGGSFNSSQDPLFIIDGVPTTTNLNTLNMNDIESMQVLKDAASASIYGSRAANGVIIITTRSGKKSEKVKVDFSANLTAQFYNKQTMMDLANTADYATSMAQAAMNDGLNPEQYANNYGLTLNAAAGTPISAYDPAELRPLYLGCHRQVYGTVLSRLQEEQRYLEIYRLREHVGTHQHQLQGEQDGDRGRKRHHHLLEPGGLPALGERPEDVAHAARI